jgi:GntR family transcriptional regulator
MDREWNDNQPIYRQLRDRVVAMILDGVLKEGDPLPSVRTSRRNIGSIRSRS